MWRARRVPGKSTSGSGNSGSSLGIGALRGHLELHGRLAVELPPADATANESRLERSHNDPVHELSIREPLNEDQPSERLVLAGLHEKGNCRSRPVDDE